MVSASWCLNLPCLLQAFRSLVSGRPAHHLELAIRRIAAFNAQALAADAKKQLQVMIVTTSMMSMGLMSFLDEKAHPG